jgi:tRNA(Ile)-lysidine synthase
MARLGPFEPRPLLSVAVSGGADSLALALLADRWARALGGSVLALVVDHGLRPGSADEAVLTMDRLTSRGIAAHLLPIAGLGEGPGVAARAREARYRVLTEACAEAGCLHLLLGHHRADQSETVMIRALGNSRSAGLAGMPALRVLPTIRLLRPLLCVPPEALRFYLREAGVAWVEDPSNRDPRALRSRLRAAGAAGQEALAAASAVAGRSRAAAEAAVADILAARVTLRPEGFAVLSPGRIVPDALAVLLRTVAGAPFTPSSAAVEALAAAPGPATLAGVRLLPAGRLGSGWLVVREEAAMQPPVAAVDCATWDGRFRLRGAPPEGTMLGALGPDAARFRSRSGLPTALLRTLGCLRFGNSLVAVPHLGYRQRPGTAPRGGALGVQDRMTLQFHPVRAMVADVFHPVDAYPGLSGAAEV